MSTDDNLVSIQAVDFTHLAYFLMNGIYKFASRNMI